MIIRWKSNSLLYLNALFLQRDERQTHSPQTSDLSCFSTARGFHQRAGHRPGAEERHFNRSLLPLPLPTLQRTVLSAQRLGLML